MSDRRHPTSWSVTLVVMIWALGLPALLFASAIMALGVGFSADSGGDGDPSVVFGTVLVVGVLGLVGLSLMLLGGLHDEPPAPPPRPYAGRPLAQVPTVTRSSSAPRAAARVDGAEAVRAT